MGITPQFADLNADGHEDMISGCFEGTIYVAWGSSSGLQKPVHLKDRAGNLIQTGRYFHLKKEKHVSFGELAERTYSAFPFDWDNDGDLDLVTGTSEGGIYVRVNEGSATKPQFATTVQPLVMDNEKEARVAGYALPVVADWNGDGLPDVVTGAKSGAYWFPNVGSVGKPILSSPRQLVCGMYAGDRYPQFRFQVSVTDFDGDGDMDLLLGDERGGKKSAGHVWLYRRVNEGDLAQQRPAMPNPTPKAQSRQEPIQEAEEIALKDLPDRVKDGIIQLSPNIILTRAMKELRDGKTVFVVLGRKGGDHFRFHVNQAGQPFQFQMGTEEFELGLPENDNAPETTSPPSLKNETRETPTSQSSRRIPENIANEALPQATFDTEFGIRMIRVEPQQFWMGSPDNEEGRDADETRRKVKISNVFWLGETEVTQAQWTQLMDSEPWKDQVHATNGNDVPATYISWSDAIQFCDKLTEKESREGRLPQGYRYGLPTEAEWELACRSGTDTRWSFGDNKEELHLYAAFDTEKNETHVHQVKSFKPNAWGFYDMHGNVAEWCADSVEFDGRVRSNAESTTLNPIGTSGNQRICRGGSYRNSAAGCRSAIRDCDDFANPGAGFLYGFRIALVASDDSESAQLDLKPGTPVPLEVEGVSPNAPYTITAELVGEELTINLQLIDGWQAYAKDVSKGEPIRVTAENQKLLGELEFPESSNGILQGNIELVQSLKLSHTNEAIELTMHLVVCNEDGCLPPKQIRLRMPNE